MGVVEGGEIPYKDAALAQKKQNFDNREEADPLNKCFLAGMPRTMYFPSPFQILANSRSRNHCFRVRGHVALDSHHQCAALSGRGSVEWGLARALGRQYSGGEFRRIQRLHLAGSRRATSTANP